MVSCQFSKVNHATLRRPFDFGIATNGALQMKPSDVHTSNHQSIDAFLPDEMARRAEDVGVKKANLPIIKMFVLAVLAGAFIALGAIFATTVTAGGNELSFGLKRLLGGLTFSLGLILVVVAGAELFTGNNLIVIATARGKISCFRLMKCWLVVYFGNFLGSVATAILVFFSRQYEQEGGAVGLNSLEIANSKCGLEFFQAIVLGVLCNALVCLAIWLCLSARSVSDKILAIIFPITAFVAAGFEHCVANMYFIPYGILVKSHASRSFWNSVQRESSEYSLLSWQNFWIANLVPVTIGNVIGGAFMVGLVYWLIYRANQPWES